MHTPNKTVMLGKFDSDSAIDAHFSDPKNVIYFEGRQTLISSLSDEEKAATKFLIYMNTVGVYDAEVSDNLISIVVDGTSEQWKPAIQNALRQLISHPEAPHQIKMGALWHSQGSGVDIDT